jgi:hypothetical protein
MHRVGQLEFVVRRHGRAKLDCARVLVLKFVRAPGDFPSLNVLDRGCVCVGDLNCNGRIGIGDLGILLAAYGIDDKGDLDHDGVTDVSDIVIALDRFGARCSAE